VRESSKCHDHTDSYTACIRWNADLTLESSTKPNPNTKPKTNPDPTLTLMLSEV